MTTAGGSSALGEIDENVERPYCVDRAASAAAHHAVIFRVDGGTLTGAAIDKKAP